MELAISNIAWDASFDEEVYLYMQKNRVYGLEIAPTRIFPSNPYKCTKQAKEYSDYIFERYGIRVISMQSIWFGRKENIFANKEEREFLLEYTKQAFDFATAMGCHNLVFGCPHNRIISNYEKDAKIAEDFLNKVGELAISMGGVFAIEANPVIYGTNFLNTTWEAVELVKKINSRGIRLNYDFGTVLQNSENILDVKKYIKYINHIHISEPNLEEIVFGNEQEVLLKCLETVGYDRYISLEMKKINNINAIKEKIAYLSERKQTMRS